MESESLAAIYDICQLIFCLYKMSTWPAWKYKKPFEFLKVSYFIAFLQSKAKLPSLKSAFKAHLFNALKSSFHRVKIAPICPMTEHNTWKHRDKIRIFWPKPKIYVRVSVQVNWFHGRIFLKTLEMTFVCESCWQLVCKINFTQEMYMVSSFSKFWHKH